MSRSAGFQVGVAGRLANSAEPPPNLEPLKTQIARQQYSSLAGTLLAVLGRSAQKLTRHTHPLPFWYNAVLFVGLTLAIGRLVQILFGTSSRVLAYGIAQPLLELVGLLSASTVVIAAAKNQTSFFATVRESIIAAIASEDDLIDNQRCLDSTFSLKRQFSAILIYGFFVVGLSMFLANIINADINVTFIIVAVLFGLLNATSAPLINAVFALLDRISTYHFQLYSADPSSSELIDRLTGMIGGIILRMGAVIALLTVFMYVFGLLTITISIVMVAIPWGMLIRMFVSGHHALARIIGKAKRRTLNDLQVRIDYLLATSDVAEKDTMEAITRLMDYHDRIKATRNSALSIGVILQFLQSLLLPLLASLLGSISELLHLFSP